MGVPASKSARLFYRCAFQRRDEARILQKAEQTTIGPVYLAGYSVECILKALILDGLSPAKQEEVLKTFRGNRGHDFEWLRERYLLNGGAPFSAAIARVFTLVSDWSTELRYIPKHLEPKEIDVFLQAAEDILRWADGRF